MVLRAARLAGRDAPYGGIGMTSAGGCVVFLVFVFATIICGGIIASEMGHSALLGMGIVCGCWVGLVIFLSILGKVFNWP